jgi:hypothetical protein
VGGLVETGGQVYTSCVQHLMPAILPQKTAGYVVDSALEGYERRSPILAIVLGEFLLREPSHMQDTFAPYSRVMVGGRPQVSRGLPLDRIWFYCMNLDTKGEVSPRRKK